MSSTDTSPFASGVSLYLAHQDVAEDACRQALRIGATDAFISLHMPEDDRASFPVRLRELTALAHAHGLRVTVDISQHALPALGLTPATAAGITAFGVDAIRIDFGLPDEDIVTLSRNIPVRLNASTITPSWLERLLAQGLDTGRVEAWHNFYPRTHTGLAAKLVAERNAMWRRHGFRTVGFVPGDGVLRAPVAAGLPTVEAHRGRHPLAAAHELAALGCDAVLVGDPTLAPRTADQWEAWHARGEVDLTIRAEDGSDSITDGVTDEIASPEVRARLGVPDRERTDPAAQLVRLEGSRPALSALPIAPTARATAHRPRGTLTVGNDRLPRYRGELSISRTDLPPDPTVNPIGSVIPRDLPLLPFIGPGTPVRLSPLRPPAGQV
ncbi:MupG family TIM beta-alpha barrel fold protein [Streptomyces sp. NPDC056144]|uniref:MupG family TIM beta-alpha barrel fold protein n=1 Tax=unclassified Streptomyces TaxID=2593676 RepID=UPI0035D6569F